jgi:deaminated glutathione amidase
LKIACLQTEPKRSIREALDEALDLASLATNEGVKFLFLPEYCGGISSNGKLYTPPSEREKKHLFLQELKIFCKKNSVWCLIGSIAVKLDNNKIVNRSLLLNNNGAVVCKYDKIHMFDIFINGEEHYESKTIDSGNIGVLVKTDFCKIGLSICYDIRFPNLYRQLAHKGAEVLTIPAAFTKTTGNAHWHILNRARAIENLAFVISPCAAGKIPGGGESYGHSLIINPWGEIIKDGGKSRGIITAFIDISLVEKYRKQLPSLQHDKKFEVKEF